MYSCPVVKSIKPAHRVRCAGSKSLCRDTEEIKLIPLSHVDVDAGVHGRLANWSSPKSFLLFVGSCCDVRSGPALWRAVMVVHGLKEFTGIHPSCIFTEANNAECLPMCVPFVGEMTVVHLWEKMSRRLQVGSCANWYCRVESDWKAAQCHTRETSDTRPTNDKSDMRPANDKSIIL